MQSQYTDKARAALMLAEKAARKLKQNYVGTEHILLGLLEEGTGVAARVLIENGANERLFAPCHGDTGRKPQAGGTF